MNKASVDESDKRKGILALLALLMPFIIMSLVWEQPVLSASTPEQYNFVKGVFPANPLGMIVSVGGLLFGLKYFFPKETENLIRIMSSPKALKFSFMIALCLTTIASTGFFHSLALAATRAEDERGSWFEGINIFIGGAGLVIQTFLTYSLYVLTKEQTRQSINQSASAASTNVITFSVTLAQLILVDGVQDPRKAISNAIEGLLLAALNGTRMGSTKDLHTIFVQLLKNHLTTPIIVVANSNAIVPDSDGNPQTCHCVAPGNPQVVQIVKLGDSIISRELEGLSLEGHVLDEFDFWEAILVDFSFRNCSLRRASLIRGTFTDVDFRGADLSGAIILPTEKDRATALLYKFTPILSDDELLPRFNGNCQFDGATMDRDLYNYLTKTVEAKKLTNLKVNAPAGSP